MVLMPVAPMDEHHGPEPGKRQVGRTGQVPAPQAESEAEAVGDGTDDPLGRSVVRADAPDCEIILTPVRESSASLLHGLSGKKR